MKLKTLIVGLGNVGMGYDLDIHDSKTFLTHAKSFYCHPYFDLVGGIDLNYASCIAFASRYGVWAGCDLVEGLETLDPDVVVIAVPTRYHAECLFAILKHAKPKLILCEKPLSYSLEDAEAMVNSCIKANCLLYVNYLRRVDLGVLEIKHRIESGAIGLPLRGLLWYSGGFINNGSHFLNLLEFWLGPVKSFNVINVGSSDLDDDFEPDVQITFSSGTVTFLAVPKNYYSHHEMQLFTPTGCLRYEQGGITITWQHISQHNEFSNYRVLSSSKEQITSESGCMQWHVTEQVKNCLIGKTSSLCSGKDALRTLESLSKIKSVL